MLLPHGNERPTQADLGRLLGSRQRASDILTRKRRLTMRMAWRLRREWGIPAEALLAPPQNAGTKVPQRERPGPDSRPAQRANTRLRGDPGFRIGVGYSVSAILPRHFR
jgi:hypothetical protein